MRIVYIDNDCLRPDHVGAYGYHRNTTPNLDKIIKDGIRFTHCYCSDAPCAPSRAALFSGRLGIHNGVVTHWGPGSEFRFPGEGHDWDDRMPMLARHLRQHGWRTISFSSFADRHKAWWFAAGWNELHTHTLKGGHEIADEVTNNVLPWLENHAGEDDYFLHINYWDAHRDYRMPAEWVEHFKDDPPPEWPDQEAIDGQQDNYGPFTASELWPWETDKAPYDYLPKRIETVDDFNKFVTGYDASIRYMDHHLGRVLEVFERKGLMVDTVFITSGDHGENMGEEGIYGDHLTCSEGVHNITMTVRWPGVTSPDSVCDKLVYNIDLPPTICDILNIPIPELWDGESFGPALKGEGFSGRDHLVLSYMLHSCQRSVRTPEWLFTRTYHPGLLPLPEVGLWDMKVDRFQTTNVADGRPEIVQEMDAKMNQWVARNTAHHNQPGDPIYDAVKSGPFRYVKLANWLERLEEKGRGSDANKIRKRLGLDDPSKAKGARPDQAG